MDWTAGDSSEFVLASLSLDFKVIRSVEYQIVKYNQGCWSTGLGKLSK